MGIECRIGQPIAIAAGTTTLDGVQNFIEACEDTNGPDLEEEAEESLPAPQLPFAKRSQGVSSTGGSFGRPTCIPLNDLFNFSPSSNRSHIARFWHQGILNLEEEMARFDASILASDN